MNVYICVVTYKHIFTTTPSPLCSCPPRSRATRDRATPEATKTAGWIGGQVCWGKQVGYIYIYVYMMIYIYIYTNLLLGYRTSFGCTNIDLCAVYFTNNKILHKYLFFLKPSLFLLKPTSTRGVSAFILRSWITSWCTGDAWTPLEFLPTWKW